MQALSQFGQQEQGRKTIELQQAYKDRDTFSEMLKVDPVYAANRKAQAQIGKVLDDVVNDLSLMAKDRKGPLTTQEIVKAQTRKGEAMAQMNMIKSVSDQINKESMMIAQNPGKFNERLYMDWVSQWEKGLDEGQIMPPQGPSLVPAFQDPRQMWSALGQKAREGARYVPGTEYEAGGKRMTPYQRIYPQQGELTEDTLEQQMLQDNYAATNLMGFFADNVAYNSPQEYNKYMQEAGGDERQAAINWFRSTRPPVYPESEYVRGTTPSASKVGGETLVMRNGGLWDGKYQVFSTEKNVPVGGDKLDNALVFRKKQAEDNTVSVPTGLLNFPSGIESKGGEVEARVHVADNNKTYFIIDRRSLDKVWFTDKAMEAMPKGAMVKDAATGLYRVKEDAEVDVVIPADTEEVKSLIDAWTGGKFSEALVTLPKKEGGKTNLMDL